MSHLFAVTLTVITRRGSLSRRLMREAELRSTEARTNRFWTQGAAVDSWTKARFDAQEANRLEAESEASEGNWSTDRARTPVKSGHRSDIVELLSWASCDRLCPEWLRPTGSNLAVRLDPRKRRVEPPAQPVLSIHSACPDCCCPA